MAGKQFGQAHDRSGNKKQDQQKGNLGQKEARQEREKEHDLSHMGEMSRDEAHDTDKD